MTALASRSLRAWIATVALVAFALCAGSAHATSPRAASLQADLDALVDAGAPGAILLVRDGGHTTRVAAGYADVARRQPMRGDEHFKVASLTKTYTAALVLQLVERGKLRLADNVERWLPGVVPNGRNITVHQLLNHTTGIPDFETDPRYLKPYLGGEFGHYWSPRQLLRFAFAHPRLFPPGQTNVEAYSNTDYVILGLIVEEITRRPIADAMARRIFAPLRLGDTTFPTKPGLAPPYAHGYMVLGKGPAVDVTGLSPSLSPASGAIVSTARDTADFYRALLSGRVIEPGLLAAMKTTISSGRHFDVPGQRYG